LNFEHPLWKLAFFDAFKKIALVAFAIFSDSRLGLRIAQVANTLL
jgi:hypothetical protein